MITFFKNILIGILIGSGAILPGVSSGVILVSLGLYEILLNTILNFFKNIKVHLKLLFPIILGCVFGVILFGNILNKFYVTYPNILKFSFIGLILGTIPSVIKTANKCSKYIESKNILLAISSFMVTVLMILIEKNMTNSLGSTSQFNYFYLILSGFLMSVGIVVPRNKQHSYTNAIKSVSYIFICYINNKCYYLIPFCHRYYIRWIYFYEIN